MFNPTNIRSFVVLIINIAVLTGSWSQAGTLDFTYGNNGATIIDLEGFEFFNGLISLPNGDQIVVGETKIGQTEDYDYIIIKLDKNGKLVSSFGENGIIRDHITAGYNGAIGIARYAEDHFLVAINSYYQDTATLTVAKFSNDGVPDATFGTNGFANILPKSNGWTAGAFMVDPVLGILVSGPSTSKVHIAKIMDNGSLDSLFGDQGIIAHKVGPHGVNPYAINKAGDGGILVTGSTFLGNDWDPFLLKVKPNGALDTLFGEQGVATIDLGDKLDLSDGMTVQDDGKIILSGGAHNGLKNDALFVRYLPTGVLDESFGDKGKVLLPTGENARMYQVIVLSDQTIIASGDNIIVKLKTDGSPDPTFGIGGIVNTGITFSNDMALDNQENIYLAGYTFDFAGGFDLATSKYISKTSTNWISLSTDDNQFKVFPNPATNETWISSGKNVFGSINIELIDLQGKVFNFWEKSFSSASKLNERLVLNPHLSSGIYFLKMHSNGHQKIFKIIKK